MENYTNDQTDVIVVDSFGELSYKQKKLFLAAQRRELPDGEKYAATLIKNVGGGVYNKLRERFRDGNVRKGILRSLNDKGVVCITVKDTAYPEYLKNTPVPPLVLYCKGDLSLLKGKCFAVVGSRRTSPAALALCKDFVRRLSQYFVVVTGIAEGADSAAAAGAAESGKVICVLPCGLDRAYASGSEGMIRGVEKRGLLVSEYPPDIAPQRYMYSMRNRIIAGLSMGTLVVSAAKRSGALITANYAVEYGRELFAFPYGIGVASGEGCNDLIKKGAYLADNPLDVASVFGIEFQPERENPLSSDEKALLAVLREQGQLHLEKLAAALNKRSYEVAAVCSLLEIKGLVVKTGGNRYAAVR